MTDRVVTRSQLATAGEVGFVVVLTARLKRLRKEYFPRRNLTAEAKAGSGNTSLTAAVNRCATQNQMQHQLCEQAVKPCLR
jgi:hypothetical protein